MSIRNRQKIARPFQPNDYILHEGLTNAVEVALMLGQPLLLTGEPGTGKTKLAARVAYDLARQAGSNFLAEPLVFNTKTTSAAQDLFYIYDAVSHFQEANIRKESGERRTTRDFVELQALGKAIAFSNPSGVDTSRIVTKLPAEPQSSVVLIDEIDKAPRDFTNDILNEIENFSFQIKELDNCEVKRAQDQQILVIMTSNSEKNLPDPFLRRCVFYHIPFPDEGLLLEIVQKQLGGSTQFTEDALRALIRQFEVMRTQSVRKKPATAELVSWLRILELKGYLEAGEQARKDLVLQNLSVLVKTREDLEALKLFLQG